MDPAIIFLILSPPVIGVGLWLYDRDYRLHGRTLLPGVAGVLVAFFMPFLVLGYSMPLFPTPSRPIEYLGYFVMFFGLIAGLAVALRFRSALRIVGSRADQLYVSGPYRYSRNPQYVLTFGFPAGYAMTGGTVLSWIAVGMFAVVLHITILIEERHLTRTFGDAYREYMAATPRYFWRW
jgi:protein-S-isoprenylcysteine O-methyltransferase Ste14